MTRESQIIYQPPASPYWVHNNGRSYTVYRSGPSKMDHRYPHTPSGLRLAIGRCDYLHFRHIDAIRERCREEITNTGDT